MTTTDLSSLSSLRRFLPWMLATAVAPACDDDPSRIDDPLRGAEPRIFYGANDTSDPTRNAVVTLSGGGCTGTLVGPSLVLTAAHCGFDNDAWRGGAWVTLPNPVTIGVGPDRDSPQFTATATQVSLPPLATGGPDWEDDIALLQLSTAVPTSQAIPRAVFLDHPAPLVASSTEDPTIFQIGFGGGRDRRIMTGHDYEDWLIDSSLPNNGFNYVADVLGVGDRGTNIEVGDSGGPMLLNEYNSPVMGVLSHWAPYGIATYGQGGNGRPSIRAWLATRIPDQDPDFRIVSIEAAGCAGTYPKVDVTVRNRGAVTRSAWVDLFTGEPAPPAIGAWGEYWKSSGQLAPHQTKTLSFTISNGFTNGWIDVLADTIQAVDEIREDNNHREASLTLANCG